MRCQSLARCRRSGDHGQTALRGRRSAPPPARRGAPPIFAFWWLPRPAAEAPAHDGSLALHDRAGVLAAQRQQPPDFIPAPFSIEPADARRHVQSDPSSCRRCRMTGNRAVVAVQKIVRLQPHSGIPIPQGAAGREPPALFAPVHLEGREKHFAVGHAPGGLFACPALIFEPGFDKIAISPFHAGSGHGCESSVAPAARERGRRSRGGSPGSGPTVVGCRTSFGQPCCHAAVAK